LESSTVDIAQEFSNMIITQRAFSANGKVVKTADEMLTELLQIK
jgi:flagellar hook protein FlgE